MKNLLFSVAIFVYAAFTAGCAGRSAGADVEHKGHAHTESPSHDHDHDHENHNHKSHDHKSGGTEAPGEDVHIAGEIIFPAGQAARLGLTVGEAAFAPFREVIRVSGDIFAAQGDSRSVVAPVAGVVSFPANRLAPGIKVAKGEALFYILSRNIEGGDAAARARALYESAKAAYERAERLLPDKIVSQREYEEARLVYLDARTRWEALSGGATERGSAVRAPSDGYIIEVNASDGEFTEVGQRLAVVAQNARQQLVALVPERYYSSLPGIRSANIALSTGEVVKLNERNGRLVSAGRSLAFGATLIPVTFEFDAHPAVIPGSIVTVYLLGAERQGVLALPLSAITESQGSHFVYKQVDEEGYVRREVRLGASDGERVEIISGLEPGTRVVTRGAIHVKMATTSAIPHSHEH